MNIDFDDSSVPETGAGEKAEDIIDSLTRIVEIIDGSESLDHIDADWARASLHVALDNATKIVADAYDAHWDAGDSSLIMNCGDSWLGWKAIRYKYSGKTPNLHWRCPIKLFLDALLTGGTVLKAEIACRKEFCKQIKSLLARPRGESRTLINDVMDSFDFHDYCYRRIHYLVDRVNLGDLDWEEFVSRVADNINYLEEILSESYVSRYVLSAKSRMRMHRENIESAQGLREEDGDNPYESEDDESECGERIPSWEHYSE